MKRAGEWGSKLSNAQHIDSQSEPIFKRTLGRRGTRMKIFAMKNTQMRQHKGTDAMIKTNRREVEVDLEFIRIEAREIRK